MEISVNKDVELFTILEKEEKMYRYAFGYGAYTTA